MPYPYTLSLAQVRKLKPCSASLTRIEQILPKVSKVDAAKARSRGCTYNDIIWSASALAMDDETLAKRLTGFLNDNAKRALHIFEEAVPDDGRVRKCIEATDKWLAGLITEEEWQTAAREAWAARAAWAAREAWAAWAAWAARAAREAWAARAAWDARDARDAWDVEFNAWQFDRLIYWLTEEVPVGLGMPAKGAAITV